MAILFSLACIFGALVSCALTLHNIATNVYKIAVAIEKREEQQ